MNANPMRAPIRPAATRFFYDRHFGCWSSPNMTSLPQPYPPYPPGGPVNEIPRYRDSQNPRWLSDTHPWLAFWPLNVNFTGDIFARLSIVPQTQRIVQADLYKFSLPRDMIESWDRLEIALLGLANFLLGRRFLLPSFAYPPLPSTCGYKNTHREPKYVILCALKARDAFIALATVCSFAIAYNIAGSDQSLAEPEWVTACRNERVSEQWLAALQQSFVCNFTPGFRAGAFVNAVQTNTAPYFPVFAAVSVPLWIWLGLGPSDALPSCIDSVYMAPYLPTMEDVRAAYLEFLQHPTPPLPVSLLHQDPAEPIVPMPLPNSRQIQGETANAFRERMRAEGEEHSARENEEERTARLMKEAAAEQERQRQDLEEPSIGTALFEWVQVPGGHLLRRQVPRREWKYRWGKFRPLQRWYLGHVDEWDLDGEDDDTEEYENVGSGIDSDNGDDDDGDSVPLPPAAGGDQHAVFPRPETYAQDIEQVYGSIIGEDNVATPSITDVLHSHYGFLALVPYTTHNRIKAAIESLTSTPHAFAAMSRMGIGKLYTKPAKDEAESSYDRAARDLYCYITATAGRPAAFPSIWDLSPQWRDHILNHGYYQYRRLDKDHHAIGVQGTNLSAQWYLLILRDAATVIQVFREGNQTLLGILRSLLGRGISFSTGKPHPREPSHPHPRERLGLGKRSQGHRFDVAEYKAYEQGRENVLQSSMGRAALMRGGILWRLAKGIVDVKAVTRGPSKQSLDRGKLVCRMDNGYLVDDDLEEADEDVICGVYHVPTGKGNQMMQLSWWPQANVWKSSGLNVGYWSVDCEDWYQRRLNEIRLGTATLQTATDWRKSLRFKASHTAKFLDGMSDLADRVLTGDPTYWETV